MDEGDTMTFWNPREIALWPDVIALASAGVMCAGIVCAGFAAPAMADGALPDLKGTWASEVVGISLGKSAAGVDVNSDTKPKIETLPIEMIIDFQDGRAIAGMKRHKYGNDRFVAVFRSGNATLRGADAEGDMDLTLLGNGDIESCYTEHGAHGVLASCGIFHRAGR